MLSVILGKTYLYIALKWNLENKIHWNLGPAAKTPCSFAAQRDWAHAWSGHQIPQAATKGSQLENPTGHS